MSSRQIAQRYWGLAPFVLVFLLVGAFFLSLLFLSVNNTLFNNGSWISGKDLIGLRPMHSTHFLLSRHALARGGADLSVWFGFQELLFKRKIRFEQVEFDLTLGSRAWLCVFLSKNDDGAYGVRLTTNPDETPDMFFQSDENGLFTRKIPFRHSNDIIPAKTISVRINYSSEDALYRVFVQDQLVAEASALPVLPGYFGFKGGKEMALVDNIRISDRDHGLVYEETFSNNTGFAGVFAGAFFTMLCVVGVFAWVMLLMRKSRINVLFSCVVFAFVLCLFCIVAWLGDQSKLTRNLYRIDDMKELVDREPSARDSERMVRLLEKERLYKQSYQLPVVLEQIASDFGFEPDPSVYRIMILGSSQTWGEGAKDREHTFSSVLAELLKNEKAPDGRKFEVVNAGVSGFNLPRLFELYKHKLAALKPDLCIINQSHADVMSGTINPDKYVETLEKFVVFNRLEGTQTAFIPEAVCRECWPSGLDYHELLHNVAGKMNIPAWDMNAFMAQHFDDGWLWVDRIHFSPAGHVLAAGFLRDSLMFHLNGGAKTPQREKS